MGNDRRMILPEPIEMLQGVVKTSVPKDKGDKYPLVICYIAILKKNAGF